MKTKWEAIFLKKRLLTRPFSLSGVPIKSNRQFKDNVIYFSVLGEAEGDIRIKITFA